MNFAKKINSFSKSKKNLIPIVFLSLLFLINGCGNGSVASLDAFLKIDKNKLSNFIGVKSLNRNSDGTYTLYWDHPSNLKDISKISYKIYLSKWTSLPAEASLDSSVLTTEDEGLLVNSKFLLLNGEQSPSGKGALLSSLAGVRSYKLDFPFTADTIYAFQIIATLPDEPSDKNQRVLVYEPSAHMLGFEGVSGLSLSDDGTLQMSWQSPSIQGIDPSQVNYSIYLSTSKQSIDTVIASGTLLKASKTTNQDQLLEVPVALLPSSGQAAIAVQTGGCSYKFNKVLPLGLTYLLEVRAVGPAGELDNNRRIIVYRRSKLNFAGLSSAHTILASDASRIELSWPAATNGSGTISYEIYDNSDFSSLIAQTTSLNYTISQPTPGRLYTLGVKAKDDTGFDDNTQLVTVAVPDNRDRLAPSFAGLVSASAASDKKILLTWAASPSTDIFKYNIYRSNNLTQAFSSTSATSQLVTGLSPGTSYTFIVRAVDTSGNEDSNTVQKSATTLTQSVPDFAGLVSASPLADTAGLTGVSLSWAPATGSVTGYRIYMATHSGSENFGSPISQVTGINTANASIGAYVAGQYTTSATVTNLTQGTDYYFIVRAFYWDGSSVRTETNQIERSVTTNQAQAPVFAGINSVTAPLSSSGFTQLNLTWTAIATADHSRFSYYEVAYASSVVGIDWSSATQISNPSATSYTLTGLSPNTTYFVAVRAVNASGSAPVTDGGQVSLSGLTTPTAPSGDALTAVTAVGTQSVRLSYTAPSATAAVSGLYNNIFLFIYQGNSAALSTYRNSLTPIALASITGSLSAGSVTLGSAPTGGALIQVAPGQFTAGSSNTFQVNGLNSNQQVCVRALAVHWVSGQPSYYLESQSSSATRCATPTVNAPSFAGMSGLSSGSTVSGFTQLTATWTAIDSAEFSNFNYYEIAWATSSGAINWSNATQIANASSSSYTITGLTANTTYYAAVRAVNSSGSSLVSNGGEVIVSGATTPLAANGDDFFAAVSSGPSSVALSYTAPSATASIGGLYNKIFIFVYQGSNSQLANYYSGVIPFVTGSISTSLSSGTATLGSAPTSGAIIQVNPGQFTAGAANTFTIAGLNSNQQVCVKIVAAYWVSASYYLPSQAPGTRCVTPLAVAPTFAGVSSLTDSNDASAFNRITVNWGSISGSCTSVDVSVSTSSATPDFTTATFPSVKGLNCATSTVTVMNLSPYTSYSIQVRAKYVVNGISYASGEGVELSKTTVPSVPAGDGVSATTLSAHSKAPPTAAVAWTLPSSGGVWNKVSLWRASAADESTATAAVRAAAANNGAHTGPTSAPLVQFNIASPASSSTASYADTSTALTDGSYWCYLMRAVYEDGTYYNASNNQTVQCGVTAYVPMNFSGVQTTTGGASVNGTWADGTAKIKLNFASQPDGDIQEYWVYASISGFSPDYAAPPWQIVDNTTVNSYNPAINGNFIYVGGQGRTFAWAVYFVVRAVHYGSPVSDTNTNSTPLLNISGSQSNWQFMNTTQGLSYYMMVMSYEASLGSGSFGNDAVTSNESNLGTCNYQFHQNKVPLHSSCGTFNSTAIASSGPALTPSSSANWHQAWTACRNASVPGSVGTSAATSQAGNFFVRLITEEEWRRHSTHTPNSYATLSTSLTGGGTNCNTSSGSLASSGTNSSCSNYSGLKNMVGNLREWVDARLVNYDISAANESRFSYGPTIGRMIANGIDNRTRRYHKIVPGSNGLALLMGSDYATSGFNYQKQYGAETETWQDPTLNTTSVSSAGTGFRCVAFMGAGGGASLPSQLKLAMANEPIYTSSDIPGSPTPTAAQAITWRIPENFYVNDTKPETVTHLLSAFPNTTSLAVWNLNAASSGNQSDFTGGGKTLTLTGSLTTGQGIDGNTYANTFNGISSYLSSTDALFNPTDAFTLGAWVYRSDWTTATSWTGIIGKHDTSTNAGSNGYVLGFNASNQLYFGPSGTAATANCSGLSPGWHHIVAVRYSSTDYRIFVDGVQAGALSTSWTMVSSPDPFELGAYAGASHFFSGRIASAFFHSGIAYTLQQVQRLYFSTFSNGGSYFASSYMTNGVKIDWSPWTKTYYNPSLTTMVDTGFTYYIYRYLEPTRIDLRDATPWAIQSGPYASLPASVTGANATALAMSPLLWSSGLGGGCTASTTQCTLVATIAGSACNSSALSGCSFTDQVGGSTGFSAGSLYNYVMMIKDSSGNYFLPKVQRFRSPYLVGDPSLNASASFRTEIRFRRASLLLVDEALQQNAPLQVNSQVMSYVPMDLSGLDHDFFIDKYEAASYSGSAANETPAGSSSWPLQATGTGSAVADWRSNAGACYESFQRTGTISTSSCGNGTVNNTTSTILKSAQGTTPLGVHDQGAWWKACTNTGITDASGNVYYKYLATPSEMFKSADWGDLAQTGTISQSRFGLNIGSTLSSLENAGKYLEGSSSSGSPTLTLSGVYTTSNMAVGWVVSGAGIPAGSYVVSMTSTTITMSSNATATAGPSLVIRTQPPGTCTINQTSPVASAVMQSSFCRSRYDVADLVGNSAETTLGQSYTGVGYDNGVDGLWLNQILPTANGSISKVDLFSGIPMAANAPSVSANSDSYIYAAGFMNSRYGSHFVSGIAGGRWWWTTIAPSSNGANWIGGGRCIR